MPDIAVRPVRLGAFPSERGTEFRVWAPAAREVRLVVEGGAETLLATEDGVYHHVFAEGVGPGARYRYRLDGGDPLPDPASRFQPEGVHGPSEVVATQFEWRAGDWRPPALDDLVFYELHLGTFTPVGTLGAAKAKLPYLRDLGITTVELMPVADFPGRWNWGYDQAALYAPSRAYGRPEDLQRFVDEAHGLGLAVFLDVIYNHLGPDGAYLPHFGPVFTERHKTPWGPAINLDDDGSDGVRALFIDNALHWLEEYRIDGLRLDATHALIDDSPHHFLAELAEHVGTLSPKRYLIAEDHRNEHKLIKPPPKGYGLDGVWVDDFHHLVRNLTAGDSAGYYADFVGATTHDIAETITKGWFYDGRPGRHTGKRRGTSSDPVDPVRCVFCIQNHDQIGNRPEGDRLCMSVFLPTYRAASALLLFAPEAPLIFMGQEWAATSPFQFFTDHNEELGPKVSQGRKREFKDFPGFEGEVPDPQDPATFERSKLSWHEPERDGHAHTLALYRDLLELRRQLPDECSASAPSDATLVLSRGLFHLVVTFEAATIPIPQAASLHLHTEEGLYATDPRPPRVLNGEIEFTRPGAAILKENGDSAR